MASALTPSVPEITECKAALRQKMLAARAALPDAARAYAAARLADQAGALCAAAGTSATAIVSGFVALRGEIDPAPLLDALAERGMALALPRIEGGALAFRRFEPGDGLVRGKFGLLEPDATVPIVRPDLMLVPLLAFDRRGQRLGYGKGFYDGALAMLPAAVTVGVAFAMQEVAAVPVESHDRGLDFVLTEAGLIDCRRVQGQ